MKLLPILLLLSTVLAACDPTNNVSAKFGTDTNWIQMAFTMTNNTVMANGKVIGYVTGTNYVAVPDVHALTSSHDTGFALGVKYGAIACRRNPDLDNWAMLVVSRPVLGPTRVAVADRVVVDHSDEHKIAWHVDPGRRYLVFVDVARKRFALVERRVRFLARRMGAESGQILGALPVLEHKHRRSANVDGFLSGQHEALNILHNRKSFFGHRF